MTDLKQRLTTRAFLDVQVPHSPHISPDGRRVVFGVSAADLEESRWVSHLWMAPLDGEGKARRLTFSYEGERAPRWSPDGKWIAFLSSRPDMTEPPPDDEDEEAMHREQVWLLPGDGGEAQRLTNAREGVKGFDWYPDSLGLVFLTAEARPQPLQFARDDLKKRKIDPVVEHKDKQRQQLWEIDLEERKPVLLYTGDFGLAEFEVSPDGKQVVFNTNGTGEPNDYDRYDLHVLDIESGETRKLVEAAGGKFHPQWSPDGKQIAYVTNREPSLSYSQECVFVVPAEGGEPLNLFAEVPYDVEDVVWSRTATGLAAVVADRCHGRAVRITPAGVEVLTTEDGCCQDLDAGTNRMVVVWEDNRTLPELYALAPDGTRRALTELNAEHAAKFELPRMEVVTWHSDGHEIEGVLVRPPHAVEGQPLPLIVQVHGGPKGRAENMLRSYYMHPVWAAEGYLVLMPNFRGSEGYGNAFATANRRDLGGGDFRDIMAGVDALIERGLADPERLGIMGGSYGGYMTNWAIGQTNRFKAAVSMFGIFNLVTDFSNSELWRWDPDYMGAYYWEDPEIYRQCSPSTHLEKIETPVLILHGESDSNTFISNSREMYQALRARGKVAEFVHYPREGHGLREPNHKLDEMRRAIGWFDRYLKGAAGEPPFYRAGDEVRHDGYTLRLLRAEDAECVGWQEEEGRLIELAFALASDDPVEERWEFTMDQVQVSAPDGGDCALQGVLLDAGGGRTLVRGSDMHVMVQPDKDTGRVAVAPALAFKAPETGGPMLLRVADMPPISFILGEQESKPEHDEGDGSPAPPSDTDDGPAPPQRP